MRKYLFIAVGGAIGAILRVAVKGIDVHGLGFALPVNTLFINIAGSFALAFILTYSAGQTKWKMDIRLGITTGLLGSFTTFSTVCKEISLLLLNGNYTYALMYAVLSVSLGLAAAWLGIFLAQKGKNIPVNCGMNAAVYEPVDFDDRENMQ